jgi:hypothetical protein
MNTSQKVVWTYQVCIDRIEQNYAYRDSKIIAFVSIFLYYKRSKYFNYSGCDPVNKNRGCRKNGSQFFIFVLILAIL